MNKYKRKSNFYPNIAFLESKDEEVRNNELIHGNESLKYMADQDKERNKSSFTSDFIEGIKTPYTWVWNTGGKVANNIDNALNLGGKVIDSFDWLMSHPYIILLLIAGGVIIIKKI